MDFLCHEIVRAKLKDATEQGGSDGMFPHLMNFTAGFRANKGKEKNVNGYYVSDVP